MRKLVWVGLLLLGLLGCNPPAEVPQEAPPAPSTLQAPQHPDLWAVVDSVRSVHHSISLPLAHAIRVAAITHNIPVSIAFALVRAESNFQPRALSWAGARGLTQVMPPTGLAHCNLSPPNLYDPILNLDCGFSFLSDLHARFDSWNLALMAYHRGPARLTKELAGGLGHGVSVAYAQGILRYAAAD